MRSLTYIVTKTEIKKCWNQHVTCIIKINTRFWSENHKRTEHFRETGIDEVIILPESKETEKEDVNFF
jgi:hypothetical protein